MRKLRNSISYVLPIAGLPCFTSDKLLPSGLLVLLIPPLPALLDPSIPLFPQNLPAYYPFALACSQPRNRRRPNTVSRPTAAAVKQTSSCHSTTSVPQRRCILTASSLSTTVQPPPSFFGLTSFILNHDGSPATALFRLGQRCIRCLQRRVQAPKQMGGSQRHLYHARGSRITIHHPPNPPDTIHSPVWSINPTRGSFAIRLS
jgi:hypothetical protein